MTAPAPLPHAVVWHELECGRYRADLELWRELAEQACAEAGQIPAPVLDVGAGSGRVSLMLAGAGHTVTALDLEPALLARLRDRDPAAAVETVAADARSLLLARTDYAACLVPMQTVQLLGGQGGRRSFLRAAHAHLRPGALLACAIVTELEEFDCAAEGLGPSAETVEANGLQYVSQAVRVHVGRRQITIERERAIAPSTQAASGHGAVTIRAHTRERDVIELDRVSAQELADDGTRSGFEAAGVRTIDATDEHVGSEVVLLRA
jgi:SAM-dependent methyltransferase